MTMFIQLVDGQPVGHAIVEDNFRALYPNTSFSWPFMPEDIEPLGFGIYDFSNQPDLGTFEKAVEVTPVKDEYGRWRQTWAVQPMSVSEVVARTEQEWVTVRNMRIWKLGVTDWTQLADAPLTDDQRTAWSTYRQILRDLPQTQTDPFNIVWPEPPTV